MREYFSHDYNNRNKKTLLVLTDEYKMAGYGLFWVIVEMLYETSEKWLELDRSTFVAVAKESGENSEFVEKFIRRGISEFKVFIEKDGKFTTERVLSHINKRLEISIKRSNAGKASAEARQNPTSVQQVSTIKVNKRKVNKRKDSSNVAFIPPSENEVKKYFQENGYSEAAGKKAFEYYHTGKWHDSKGKPVKNWKQKMISVWFKEENKTPAVTLFSGNGSNQLSAREKHDLDILNNS